MRLTDEQKSAVASQGNALVTACPGSGKTRTLIAKLIQSIDEIKDSPRKVACITYTNAAVHEIEHRVLSSGIAGSDHVYDISTIHVFCLNYILRPFVWKLEGFDEDFKVLSPDSERYAEIMADFAARYRLDRWAQEAFGQISYALDGGVIIPDKLPEEAALEYAQLLDDEGYFDFASLIYYAYALVRDNAEIARAIGARFEHILVDEFQDTSLLQTEIFTTIFDQGRTRFFLVGDPEQSIYGFAGATPALMRSFAHTIQAELYSLSGNFRSNKAIVACAERVIAREPDMFAANKCISETQPPVSIGEADDFKAITEHFLPALDEHGISYGNAAVLASSWFALLPLGKRLREHGIPIIGPGARPYKRAHVFGRLIEPICEYLKHPSHEMVKRIEKELFFLILNITGKTANHIFSYQGRCVVYQMLHAAKNQMALSPELQTWLYQCAQVMTGILIEEELLNLSDSGVLTESVQSMLNDMLQNNTPVEGLQIGDLGVFANPTQSLKLTTMHQSKGREFDAVAMVGVNEGKIPFHNFKVALTQDSLEESRRLFYVSVTRAQRLLMAFSDPYKPSQFLVALD